MPCSFSSFFPSSFLFLFIKTKQNKKINRKEEKERRKKSKEGAKRRHKEEIHEE